MADPTLAERLAGVLQGHGPHAVLDAIAQVLHGQAAEIRRHARRHDDIPGRAQAMAIDDAADDLVEVAERFPVEA